MDEISYRRGHYYLTVVADHDSGRVVWVAKGKRGQALQDFYDALGAAGARTVSRRCRWTWAPSTATPPAERCPEAVICFDPFHVIQIANRALDRSSRPAVTAPTGSSPTGQWRAARCALRSGAERLTDHQRQLLNALRRYRYRLWRAWELKEDLRDLYRCVDPDQARPYLKRWITSALRSRIPAFVNLARQIRHNFDGIIAAVELGLSNSRLEGINGKIRLIQRRGYGYHSVDSLAASIYLCLGGITIQLPTRP